MPPSSQVNRLFNIGILAAFATLAFVGTTIIRIPIPASGGYFNLGDTFVMAAALLYGPWIGGLVGLIGPALADAIGFPQFILATAIVKGVEGAAVGLIGWTPRGAAAGRVAAALAAGILILPTAALAEILPNLFQGIFSAVIAFGIWRVLGKKQSD